MTNDSKTTDAANDETPRVCTWCDKPLRADETEHCAICGESMCEDCAYKCDRCDDILCENCATECGECGGAYCPSHLLECHECPNHVCYDCAACCTNCGESMCEDCRTVCDSCDEYVCRDCRYSCENCGDILCGECVQWSDQDDCAYCENCLPESKAPAYSPERQRIMNSHEHMFTVGLEIEINGGHDHDKLKNHPLIAGYCTDGSLYHRDGLEYQTDILFTTDFDAINELVESIHCYGDEPERAGGHMHVRRTRRQTPSRWYWALKGLSDRQARNLNMRHTYYNRWCELRHGDYSGKDTAVNDTHADTIELRTFARWDDTTATRLAVALEWAHHMWRYFESHELYQLKTADIMRESARSAYATPRTTPAMRLATSRKEN